MADRCRLCGGKLRAGVCTECGMDNRKSDEKYYKLFAEQEQTSDKKIKFPQRQDQKGARSSVVKEKAANRGSGKNQKRNYKAEYERKMEQARKYSEFKSASGKQRYAGKGQLGGYVKNINTPKSNYKKKKGGCGIYILIAVLFLTFFGNVFSHAIESLVTTVTSKISDPEEKVYQDGDYEADRTGRQEGQRQLDVEGEVWEKKISAGMYVVGVDIPEGVYTLAGKEGGFFQVTDSLHSVYDSGYFEDEIKKVEDIDLFQGAIVSVDGMSDIRFRSENAQIDKMEKREENPLTESYEVTGEATAGKDFTPGTYDLIPKGEQFGTIELEYQRDPKESYPLTYFIMLEEHPTEDYPRYSSAYRNFVIPEGMTVKVSGITVELVPSEGITTENYGAFYDNM